MDNTMNTAPTKAGKGLGTAGFVIALVALVLWIFISGAAVLSAVTGGGMGTAIFWTLLSLTGAILSLMGFMKARSGGGKKGLAIAGLIIGLVATLLSVRTIFLVKEAQVLIGDSATEILNKMSEGMKEGMEQALDSLKNDLNSAPSDTTAH